MESGEVLERAIEDLRTIALDNDTSQMIHVSDVFDRQGSAEEMFENMASKNGVPLGWNQFDEVTDGGVHPGELVVVAARPSMGKTAWACNAARSTSVVRKKVTAFFPLEQPKEAMIRRMLSASACIDYKDIRRNTLRLQDRRVLLEHREILRQAPLYFDDTPGLTVSRIKARCMQLKARHGLDIAFIDQLSKIKGTDVYRKGMQPREIVGAQTEALKLMAQELGIPVVVFNQLSRKTGDRKDAIPTLSDLKESGDIEEDADLVCLLHRPEYYDKSDPSLHGIGQMIIAKQREGETKTLNCLYQGRIMRWEDDTEPPPAKQSSFSSHDSYYDRPPAWEAYEGI
jgi:replicative DNA helicase